MGDFARKCKNSFCRAVDNSFFISKGNFLLSLVCLLLVISLFVKPTFLVAMALFSLVLWIILYC